MSYLESTPIFKESAPEQILAMAYVDHAGCGFTYNTRRRSSLIFSTDRFGKTIAKA
jgi:hypothetical protein